jgi:hypothetical protein
LNSKQAERAPDAELAGQIHLGNEHLPPEAEASRAAEETRLAGLAAAEEETRLADLRRQKQTRELTINVNHYLEPIKVKATIANDGISLNLLLANAVLDTVKPTFNELAKLCKQLASKSNEFTGRRVYEFVGVRWYGIVAYILGRQSSLGHRHSCQL